MSGDGYYGPGSGGGGYDDRGREPFRAGGGGGRGGGGGYDDRSRSREPHGRGGGRGGPYGDRGGGRGGGSWGGGRGGGGGGHQRKDLEARGVVVKTNHYAIEFESNGEKEWIMYRIQIMDAWRERIKDETDETKITFKNHIGKRNRKTIPRFFKENAPQNAEEERDIEKRNRSSTLSRRILLALQKQRKQEQAESFITDGTAIAYSCRPLFDHATSSTINLLPSPEELQKGHYGPADDGTSNRPQGKQIPASQDFFVRVKAECEDDDPDGESIKNRWFAVRFVHAGNITFTVVDKKIQQQQIHGSNPQEIQMAMNMAIRNAMLSNMICFGRSPKMFLFDPEKASELQNLRHLTTGFRDLPQFKPLLGLIQAAAITKCGNPFVVVDLGIQWIHKNKDHQRNPIPVLQVNNDGSAMIAGKIKIWNVSQIIPPDDDKSFTREVVLNEMKKLVFDVRYPEVTMKRKDGAVFKKKIIRKGLRLVRERDVEDTIQIAWAADDAKEWSFKGKDDEDQTVAQYLQERYNITLRYPKMPLVRVSKQEFFPFEFLFHALSPARGTTEDIKQQMLQTALKVNDNLACTKRVDGIFSVLSERSSIGEAEDDFLKILSMRRSREPLTMRAEVLKEPKVKFGGTFDSPINDGSWNLKGVRFRVPSELFSFAVADLTGYPPGAMKMMQDLLQQCRAHGMIYPPRLDGIVRNERLFGQVTASSATESIENSLIEAVRKAKAYYLHDLAKESNRPVFKTLVKPPEDQNQGIVMPAIVMPLFARKEGLPHEFKYMEHRPACQIQLKVGGKPFLALKKYRVYPPETVEAEPKVVETRRVRFDVATGASTEAEIDGEWQGTSPHFDKIYATGTNLFTHEQLELDPPEFVLRTEGHISERIDEFFGVIYETKDKNNELWPSHYLHNPADLEEAKAARLKYISEEQEFDPFDLDAIPANARPVFKFPNNDAVIEAADAVHVSPYHVVDASRVECPSIVIVFSKDNNAGNYNVGKMIANVKFGIQSQVVLQEKYKGQKFPQQYCSNIALKMNTKLSNHITNGRAWEIEGGLPWINEHTMVIGITSAKKPGQEAKMVVVVVCNLDEFCISMGQEVRLARYKPVVPEKVLVKMIEGLIDQFVFHNRLMPTRVLVYRSSGHDKQFRDIIVQELSAVRQAFYNKGSRDCEASMCHHKGCNACTPPITFCVAQTMHSAKMVYANENDAPHTKKKNVPSGTCLYDKNDNTLSVTAIDNNQAELEEAFRLRVNTGDGEEVVDEVMPQAYVSDDNRDFNFLLTAHGGIKGTSKPVLYRVLWNENYLFQNGGDTSQLDKKTLMKLTYAMSFLYGTATKAPRVVPVLLYGTRTATTVLGYVDNLGRTPLGVFRPPENEEDGAFVSPDGESCLLKAFSGLSFRPHLAA